MSSYTPIDLPYFAPAHVLPAPLPTLDQVLSSSNYLISPESYGKELSIVRIGDHFVAKYGKSVRPIEAENMLFVKQRTTIPVPQVYAIYTFGDKLNKTMIIMEFIKGNNLHHSINTMSPQQLDNVKEQLKAQVNQLRQIPAPSYYGSIGRRPLLHVYSGRQYGPFDSISDMIRENFNVAFRRRNGPRFIELKNFFSESLESVTTGLGNDFPVFSHGDLHEENIIVQPNASRFNFLDEFPYELQIMLDAHSAWNKACIEEVGAESENGSSSTGSGSKSESS